MTYYANEEEFMRVRLKQMLIKHEGKKTDKRNRHMPYRCSEGYLTIGYGRNIETEGISEKEAEMLLGNDIAKAGQETMSVFPMMWNYSDNRQNVLIDMMFNLGKTRFLKFKKFISAVKNEDWERAANEMEDSLWFKQVGKRGEELKALMLNG